MKFNKIALQEGDYFDRTEFTSEQIGLLKDNYDAISELTWGYPSYPFISLQTDNMLGYVHKSALNKGAKQLHPSDFFPHHHELNSSEGDCTKEELKPLTEAPIDSEEVLQLSNIESFITKHKASVYIKPEDCGVSYMIYLDNEDEYKINSLEDLNKLDNALMVLKELSV